MLSPTPIQLDYLNAAILVTLVFAALANSRHISVCRRSAALSVFFSVVALTLLLIVVIVANLCSHNWQFDIDGYDLRIFRRLRHGKYH